MKLGGSAGALGKDWAQVSEPLIWHEDADNPILVSDPNISFEASAMATPALYQFRRKWYLYFQGAHSGYYIKQHWALWGMNGDEVLKRIAALP